MFKGIGPNCLDTLMHTYMDCMPCFIRQSLEAVRHATHDISVHERVVRKILRLASELDMSQSPPAVAQQIHRCVRDLSGIEDPYHYVKQQFNRIALKLHPEMRHRVMASDSPLETAIRLAIAGNIIDFGIFGTLHQSDLERAIEDCLTTELEGMDLPAFEEAIENAGDILYLADNAGEIVLDRLLIERLPLEKVTVAVKGSPIINDATLEDALCAGLTEIVEVMDNGSDAPGTLLESCSKIFRDRFENADLIIAKGQGNYETLSNIDKHIYFLLKAKCPVIAGHIGCQVGRMIFQKSTAFAGEKENAGI